VTTASREAYKQHLGYARKKEKEMNASDLFPPSEYLKSEDIEEAGGEMQLTVKGVSRKEYEEEDGTKTVKGLLTFNETSKKLSLNVTNTHAMMTMYGEKDIDRVWLGKTVILYVDPNVKNKGKIVKGLRIRLVDEKQDLVTAFWKKAREMGFTPQEGRDHLAQFAGDFKQALEAL
jgi:hypothetical protein